MWSLQRIPTPPVADLGCLYLQIVHFLHRRRMWRVRCLGQLYDMIGEVTSWECCGLRYCPGSADVRRVVRGVLPGSWRSSNSFSFRLRGLGVLESGGDWPIDSCSVVADSWRGSKGCDLQRHLAFPAMFGGLLLPLCLGSYPSGHWVVQLG